MHYNFGTVCILVVALSGCSLSFPKNETFLPPQVAIGGIEQDVNTTGNQTVPSDDSSVHIVGGVRATPNEFPWLVNLRIDGAFCGGSLIGLDLVLTAAHCLVKESGNRVIPVKPNLITVYVGDHLLNQTDAYERRIVASGVKIHEDYNPETFKNDIALIRLSANITLSTQVRPIPYANTTNNGNATSGEIAGKILNRIQVPSLLPTSLYKTSVKWNCIYLWNEYCYEINKIISNPDWDECKSAYEIFVDACKEILLKERKILFM